MTLAPFTDNATGPTLARAVGQYIASARMGGPVHLDIASGFFDLSGFLLLADHLRDGDSVQLLLGAEPPREADLPPPQPGEPTGPDRYRDLLERALGDQYAGLRRARDLLPFDAATDRAIAQLLGMLAGGRLDVRRVEAQFLPARGVLVRTGGGGAFVGGMNLSRAGLTGGPTVVLGHTGTAAVSRLWEWFDRTWAAAVPFDLAELYQPLTANFDPYLIYLRVLFALYGEELEQELAEEGAAGDIPITSFQQHGVARAERIINKHGGVLIADGVGLGKTFTAGEIIRRYREQRQRVLLVCPAALRDGPWKEFLHKYQLPVTCVSYEQLAADRQLGGDRQYLQPLDEYHLVVVDEAHNYRNPTAPARAGVLRQLLKGPRRHVVLLTATPVNNSVMDVYYLLRYFLKQDAALAESGVPSISKPFKAAHRQEPTKLDPDTLYPLLDAVTVKRTRHFVKKHYENELIKLPDGRVVPIRFPRPVPSSITYDLNAVLPGFLARLESALMPPTGRPRLTMARYQVENYAPGGDADDRAVVGLLRSALLKRFESSVHAFAKTAEKMVREHELFLRGLDRGVVLHKAVLRELSASEDADADELLDEIAEGGETGDPAAGYDAVRLRRDVESDLAILRDFQTTAVGVAAAADPKLAALTEELARIADEAKRDAIDADDERRNRKVLVFSFFADTVDWVYDFLRERVQSDPRLAAYRDRLAAVHGAESVGGVTRTSAVAGFAPESAGPTGGADRFDILVTTDVLAEGLNLQQCRNVVNFDLPWNPMRLVQRHGRVDRIGSPHPRVFLRTFFPDRELNRLLDLEQRVRRKLAQAAASVGLEVAPIERAGEADVWFAETRDEIERLRNGDAALYERGGTAGAAQTGEEYRQELRKALARLGDKIRTLPWRAGSGLRRGDRRGHVFCADVGGKAFVRFIPFRAKESNDVIRELGYCLRIIECSEPTPRCVPDDLLGGAFVAWSLARQNIYDDWSLQTDPANTPKWATVFLRDVADFLRRNPPSGVGGDDLDRYIQRIEAPLPRREEAELRRVFGETYPGNRAKADAIKTVVDELGLEPFEPPAPLPPISLDEVHLICWMAVEVGT